MNEVRSLVEAFDAANARGERCALATVVSVEGSSYRRPGARMLICEDGVSTGTISAGCLEADVVEHAKRVIRMGKAALVEYDTASTGEEMAWGLGLGCNGVVRVLVEPLAPQSSYIVALRRSLAAQSNTIIATVFHHSLSRSAPEPGQAEIGSRLVIDTAAEISCDILNGELLRMIERDARAALITESSGVSVYELSDETVKVFVETLAPPVSLVVFGAGQDALPIIELARGLGWHTEVVDLQARPASRSRFTTADKVTLARPETFGEQVCVTPRTLALVMTHNYTHDQALLNFLLTSPARYIGVMGPRKRTERMLKELAESDGSFQLEDKHVARLYAPVGLDIGASTPQEIALSIVAEMRATITQREGGHLRRRHAAIHEHPATDFERVPQPVSLMR